MKHYFKNQKSKIKLITRSFDFDAKFAFTRGWMWTHMCLINKNVLKMIKYLEYGSQLGSSFTLGARIFFLSQILLYKEFRLFCRFISKIIVGP